MEEKDAYTSEELFDELIKNDVVNDMFIELTGIDPSYRDYYEYVRDNQEAWQEVLDVSASFLSKFLTGIEKSWLDKSNKHYYYQGDVEDILMGMFIDAVRQFKHEEFMICVVGEKIDSKYF